MKISIEKALKLKLANEYHKRDLLANYEIYKEINKFHKCYSEIEITERDDNKFWIENTKFILENDVIGIVIRYNTYNKQYHFFGNWNQIDMKNISNYQINDFRKNFKKPRGVGKLSKKKIADWIKYETDIYLACKKKNDELEDNTKTFLKTLEGQNVQWHLKNEKTGQYSGEIIKNGIKYSFTITNGYVNQKIEVYYKVPTNLDSFLLLSDNKINRENKIKRILKN